MGKQVRFLPNRIKKMSQEQVQKILEKHPEGLTAREIYLEISKEDTIALESVKTNLRKLVKCNSVLFELKRIPGKGGRGTRIYYSKEILLKRRFDQAADKERCSFCGSNKHGITKDCKSSYLIHESFCFRNTNQTSTGLNSR